MRPVGGPWCCEVHVKVSADLRAFGAGVVRSRLCRIGFSLPPSMQPCARGLNTVHCTTTQRPSRALRRSDMPPRAVDAPAPHSPVLARTCRGLADVSRCFTALFQTMITRHPKPRGRSGPAGCTRQTKPKLNLAAKFSPRSPSWSANITSSLFQKRARNRDPYSEILPHSNISPPTQLATHGPTAHAFSNLPNFTDKLLVPLMALPVPALRICPRVRHAAVEQARVPHTNHGNAQHLNQRPALELATF